MRIDDRADTRRRESGIDPQQPLGLTKKAERSQLYGAARAADGVTMGGPRDAAVASAGTAGRAPVCKISGEGSQWPVSKKRTTASGMSRLNASAPGGRKNGSFLPHTARNGGL